MTERHPLLARQLARCIEGDVPTSLGQLLSKVDEAYRSWDEERRLLERSMEISSRELLQVNSELRAVLSAFPDLFLWVDRGGRIVDVKVGDTEDPFLSRDDMVGQNLGTLHGSKVGQKFVEAYERARVERAPTGFEYDLPGADPKRVHDARFFALDDDQVFVILRDVTDTRRVELAEAASRAKSDFLANMSHELRTPLHGILSFAGFGRKRTARDEAQAKLLQYFSAIEQSGGTLLQLVDELLDVAKLDSGMMRFEFAPMDIRDVVSKEVDHFHSQLSDRRLAIEHTLPDEPMMIQGDAKRLAQVVRNIVANAIKFSPENGRIEIVGRALADTFSLVVVDDGPGIPEDEIDDVFKEFVQSTRTTTGAGGTGLGLSISRQIVEAHHGRIWAENGATGARFHVTLPPLSVEDRQDVVPEHARVNAPECEQGHPGDGEPRVQEQKE